VTGNPQELDKMMRIIKVVYKRLNAKNKRGYFGIKGVGN